MATTPDTSIPWYRKPADRPKELKTFRVYKEHLSTMAEKAIDSGALVRLLLDMYFKGLLPEAEKWYQKGEGRQ